MFARVETINIGILACVFVCVFICTSARMYVYENMCSYLGARIDFAGGKCVSFGPLVIVCNF